MVIPFSRRFLLAVLAALAIAGAPGCSDAARRFDRDFVSKGIEERTGHGLRPPPTEGEDADGKASGLPPIPPTVDLSDGLSEDEAVEIALWRNAELGAQLEELGVARADLLQAGLLRNPTFEILFPIGKKELEMTAGLPLELGGQIFFRKKAAAFDLEATARRLIHAGVDLAAKVRSAHAEVVAALVRARRQDDVVRLFDEAARLTEARERAGDASGQEVRLARLEALAARRDRDRIAQEAAVDRERLDLFLGLESHRVRWDVPLPPETDLAAPPPPDPPLPPADLLVAYALEHRLDAIAAELEARAATERIGLAWSSIVPVISPLLSVKTPDGESTQVGPGVSADIPVLDWNQGGIARAKAGSAVAFRRWLAVRDEVAADVRESLENLAGERRQVEMLRRELLPRAEEAARSARRAFEAGEESFLVVIEISRRLAEARRDEAEASLRLRRAEIALDRSLGGRLPPPLWSPRPEDGAGGGGSSAGDAPQGPSGEERP